MGCVLGCGAAEAGWPANRTIRVAEAARATARRGNLGMVAETSSPLAALRRDRKILVKDSGTLTLGETGHQIMGSPKGDNPQAGPDPRDPREGYWDGSRVRWRSSRVPEAAWAGWPPRPSLAKAPGWSRWTSTRGRSMKRSPAWRERRCRLPQM